MEAKAPSFGEFVRQERKNIRLSLRGAATMARMDPGGLSRCERGLLPAPWDQSVLSRLAAALRLEKEGEKYRAFMELAAVSAGRIEPQQAAGRDLVGSLPLLHRLPRKRKASRETLIALAKKIRGAGGDE
jgi:hypothetical protein